MPARKKTAEELTRVGRSPGRTAGGRPVNATDGTAACPHAARRLARARHILDDETFGIYAEAIDRIERQTPHVDGYHGMPSSLDAREDIAVVENAINTVVPPELQLNASRLYALIAESAEYLD
jgi:hypothetical protein